MGAARRNDPFTLDPLPFTAKDGSGSGLVVWPVFKTAMEAPSAAPVGSIPTRSRHPSSAWLLSFLAAVLFISTWISPAVAQDSAAVRRRPPALKPDTLSRRYISPL